MKPSPYSKEVVGMTLQMKMMSDLLKSHARFNEGLGKIESYLKGIAAHAQEVRSHAERIKTLPRGPKGDKGDMPNIDFDALVQTVADMVPKPADGEAPSLDEIIAAVTPYLPKNTEPKQTAVDYDALVEILMQKILEGKKLTVDHVSGLRPEIDSYRNQLAGKIYGKDTWARGGGDTVAAGTGIAVSTDQTTGKTVITNTNPGGGATYYTPTGTVDGSNKSFTVTAQPTLVIADGATYFEGAGYSYAALTITMDTAPSQYVRYTL